MLSFSRIALVTLVTLGVTLLQAAPSTGPQHLDPISVGIGIPNKSYVLGEPIPVQLLVRNNTPAPITLGKGNFPAGTFIVTKVGDLSKRTLARDPLGCLPRPLTLQPNEERLFTVDLEQAANFRDGGRFFVTFGALYNGIQYNTAVQSIEIVPGYILAEGTQVFAKDPNRQRHFTLVRWSRDRVDRIFLRVEDTPDGRYFPTLMLGAYIPLMKPRLNIAPNGEVTILHRATPEFYVRNVFWSLPQEFVRRSSQNLLDPATADTARLNGMQKDFDEVIEKNERFREAIRLR